MKVPPRRTAIIVALIAVVFSLAGVTGCRLIDRHQATTILNIEQLPASVSDIDCASFGFTDVLQRCAFKIAPADFGSLLAGYEFVEPVACRSGGPVGIPCSDTKERAQSSLTYCCGPKVGPDFAVARTFTASPKDFEHGGSITILANQSRTRALVDLYIE